MGNLRGTMGGTSKGWKRGTHDVAGGGGKGEDKTARH